MPSDALLGIDRMVRNAETKRFERSLSALTAAGALVTAAEIYFEHDSASKKTASPAHGVIAGLAGGRAPMRPGSLGCPCPARPAPASSGCWWPRRAVVV